MKNIIQKLYNHAHTTKRQCTFNTLLIAVLIVWNAFLTVQQLEPKQPKTPPADLPTPVYIIKDLKPEDLR